MVESLKVASEALEKGKQRKEAVLAAMNAKKQLKEMPPATHPSIAAAQTPKPTKRIRSKVTPVPQEFATPSTKTPDAKNPKLGESAKKALFGILSALAFKQYHWDVSRGILITLSSELMQGEATTPPPAQPHRAMSLASDAPTLQLGQSPGTLEKAPSIELFAGSPNHQYILLTRFCIRF